MFISDTLLRASLNQKNQKSENDIDFAVHSIINSLPIYERKLKQFTSEIVNDSQLIGHQFY